MQWLNGLHALHPGLGIQQECIKCLVLRRTFLSRNNVVRQVPASEQVVTAVAGAIQAEYNVILITKAEERYVGVGGS